MSSLGSIVVVGASTAGLRAAEVLREEGFDGRLTLVGDEDAKPYDRPPLSKQVLAGKWGPDDIGFPAADADLDLDWRLGTPAESLDLTGRAVRLAGGEAIGFDGLVIASGCRPRTPSGPRSTRAPGSWSLVPGSSARRSRPPAVSTAPRSRWSRPCPSRWLGCSVWRWVRSAAVVRQKKRTLERP